MKWIAYILSPSKYVSSCKRHESNTSSVCLAAVFPAGEEDGGPGGGGGVAILNIIPYIIQP